MSFPPLLRSGAVLVASAVLGGVVAVGAVAALGGLDHTTTVAAETFTEPSPKLAPSSDGMRNKRGSARA